MRRLRVDAHLDLQAFAGHRCASVCHFSVDNGKAFQNFISVVSLQRSRRLVVEVRRVGGRVLPFPGREVSYPYTVFEDEANRNGGWGLEWRWRGVPPREGQGRT